MHRILEKALGHCLGNIFTIIILWILLVIVYCLYGKSLFPVKFNRVRREIAERQKLSTGQPSAET
jgi:hypothetical protein